MPPVYSHGLCKYEEKKYNGLLIEEVRLFLMSCLVYGF